MKFLLFLMLIFDIQLISAEQMPADIPDSIFVCSAGDPKLLGEYVKSSGENDGAPLYTNANDLSFFRNRNFWYLGNMGTWPPETHYRCVGDVEICNEGLMYPPLSANGGWTINAKFGSEPIPTIFNVPCGSDSGDSTADEL